jgi:hypothetical protein
MPFGAFQQELLHLAMSGGWRFEKKLSLIRTIHPEFDPVLGLRWSKSSEQHG